MTRAAVVQKVGQAPEEALALVEAVVDAASRGETPKPWDPAWREAVRAMERSARVLRDEGQVELADALDGLVDHLTGIFPVVEAADDLTPEERAAVDEAWAEYGRGEYATTDEVARRLGVRR